MTSHSSAGCRLIQRLLYLSRELIRFPPRDINSSLLSPCCRPSQSCILCCLWMKSFSLHKIGYIQISTSTKVRWCCYHIILNIKIAAHYTLAITSGVFSTGNTLQSNILKTH